MVFKRFCFLVVLGLLPVLFAMPARSQDSTAPPPATIEPSVPRPHAGNMDATAPTTGKTAVPVGLRELSPWSMFREASPLVQLVMAGLAFASLVTWTIFIGKLIELGVAKRRLRHALRAVDGAGTLAEALDARPSDRSVVRAFIATAINEARLSSDIDNATSIKERVASSFAEITRSESRRIRTGMGLLATIGATSPFVGLFGTVWGIMNSFIGISKSQVTNLAVVAPGIAEALLATAIGLFAAIPAVVIYNHFTRATKGYLELVGRAAGAVGRQLSRDLDRTHRRPMSRAAE